MDSIFSNCTYFGLFITIFIFLICTWIKNKTKSTILNPLLTSILGIVAILLMFNITYDTYNNGAKYLTYFLTPTTVCLAVPLYKQINKLKENTLAILVGIFAGCISNAIIITIFSKLFNLSNEISTSLLPKSVTTPIAIGICSELGGISSITVLSVVASGVLGAVIAPIVFKFLKIKNAVAQGLACGTASHGCGTSTALELGEIQGAMSGLSITITGLFTVIIAPIVNNLFFN